MRLGVCEVQTTLIGASVAVVGKGELIRPRSARQIRRSDSAVGQEIASLCKGFIAVRAGRSPPRQLRTNLSLVTKLKPFHRCTAAPTGCESLRLLRPQMVYTCRYGSPV